MTDSASLSVGLSLGLIEVDLAEMLPDAGEEVGAGAGAEQRELAGPGHWVGPRVGLAESAPLWGPGHLGVTHHLESRDSKLSVVKIVIKLTLALSLGDLK